MRVLITGATGFLGSHLVEAFAQHGATLAAVVRPTSDTHRLQALGVRLHTATLDQPDLLSEAMHDTDAVVHAAAKVHTHGGWPEFRTATIDGTRHVLNAAIAARVPHFLDISSVGVYGQPRPDGQPYTETSTPGRIDRWNYYSRAKTEAEHLVQHAQQTGAIATTIFRPTWVYGPRDLSTIGRILVALRARRLKLIGPGTNTLSLIYVTDVARAVVTAAANPQSRGQIFNVSADELGTTQREFFQHLCRLMALPEPTQHISYSLAHRLAFLSECIAHATRFRICPPLTRLTVLLLGGQRQYSSEKLRRVLGWQPTINITDGLRLTADSFRTPQ